MINWIKSHVIMTTAWLLLTLHGVLLYLDATMETLFLDEFVGTLIVGALLALIAKQRKLIKFLKGKAHAE